MWFMHIFLWLSYLHNDIVRWSVHCIQSAVVRILASEPWICLVLLYKSNHQTCIVLWNMRLTQHSGLRILIAIHPASPDTSWNCLPTSPFSASCHSCTCPGLMSDRCMCLHCLMGLMDGNEGFIVGVWRVLLHSKISSLVFPFQFTSYLCWIYLYCCILRWTFAKLIPAKE